MLAYSSVAHSGYILAAFAALQGGGVAFAVQAVLIYTAAYAVMNMGAFLVIDLVGEDTKSYNGLVRTNPGVAASMALFMAALVGIPPLSGFFGKLWIIIRNMILEEPTTDTRRAKGNGAVRFSVYVLAVLTTLFGLLIIPLSALVGASGLA
jgi:NADH-quinone oxidoreductase subunit N